MKTPCPQPVGVFPDAGDAGFFPHLRPAPLGISLLPGGDDPLPAPLDGALHELPDDGLVPGHMTLSTTAVYGRLVIPFNK